uniref:Uncharacterized protein n=1 Tax=Labrus bergylta TaxID=56723 RepID=A0A3Q3FPV5_9LABR
MAAANYHRSEDQFLCSICLDVFNDPVSTSCGHNFCRNCITEHWNMSDQYLCPMCKTVFNTRPELHVNTLLSEMVGQFRDKAQQEASSSSSELQELCTKHDKPLELFCKTDQTCVCMLCSVLDHKTHELVPLKEEYEEKKAKLEETEAEIQQMIQKRQLKIQEIKHSVDLSKDDADREMAEGVRVFIALKESVERGQVELIDTIEKKQKTTEKQAEAFIRELEQEICELMKRSTDVQQVSHSEDHLHLIQRVQSVNSAPPTKDWTEVNVCQPLYEGTVRKAVAQLEETLSEEMKKLVQAELKRVQQYAVDVTLDPDTAHPQLILSEDGKQVHHADVLGKQSFSSGRFYFEVQVKGKTGFTLGVARESINRKGLIKPSPKKGFWTICLRNGNEYTACTGPSVCLSLMCPSEKVGVFVDYEEGLVSFYDVDSAETMTICQRAGGNTGGYIQVTLTHRCVGTKGRKQQWQEVRLDIIHKQQLFYNSLSRRFYPKRRTSESKDLEKREQCQ